MELLESFRITRFILFHNDLILIVFLCIMYCSMSEIGFFLFPYYEQIHLMLCALWVVVFQFYRDSFICSVDWSQKIWAALLRIGFQCPKIIKLKNEDIQLCTVCIWLYTSGDASDQLCSFLDGLGFIVDNVQSSLNWRMRTYNFVLFVYGHIRVVMPVICCVLFQIARLSSW